MDCKIGNEEESCEERVNVELYVMAGLEWQDWNDKVGKEVMAYEE